MIMPFLTECPRDAMQGIKQFIPTAEKTAYINRLLHVGFDVIDAGSFVSPKAIPQMADTAKVLSNINLHNTSTRLLVIIANLRGAEEAAKFDTISILGFPFSLSETFQQRNTHSGMHESLKRVEEIKKVCDKNQKELLIYLSMAFGNPYGDLWSSAQVVSWGKKFRELGIKNIALADTTGIADAALISEVFNTCNTELSDLEITAHLHAKPQEVQEKLESAWNAGCRRFDMAFKGAGGCPMASDHLTGNMNTETIVNWLNFHKIPTKINREAFQEAAQAANWIFDRYN